MNELNNMRSITLKDLWELFLRRIAVIVLVAAIAAGSLFMVDKISIKPMCASPATMYILRKSRDENSSSGEVAMFSGGLGIYIFAEMFLWLSNNKQVRSGQLA